MKKTDLKTVANVNVKMEFSVSLSDEEVKKFVIDAIENSSLYVLNLGDGEQVKFYPMGVSAEIVSLSKIRKDNIVDLHGKKK